MLSGMTVYSLSHSLQVGQKNMFHRACSADLCGPREPRKGTSAWHYRPIIYIYIYIHMYRERGRIYIYIYIYLYVYVYVCIIHMYIYIYSYVYVFIYVNISLSLSLYIYIYREREKDIYIHIYTWGARLQHDLHEDGHGVHERQLVQRSKQRDPKPKKQP